MLCLLAVAPRLASLLSRSPLRIRRPRWGAAMAGSAAAAEPVVHTAALRAAPASTAAAPAAPATLAAAPAASAALLPSARWPLCNHTSTGEASACDDGTPAGFNRVPDSLPMPFPCYWANVSYGTVLRRPLQMCTHDPAVDTTIAKLIHRDHSWEGTGLIVSFVRMVKSGLICTRERPFVLDLGMNIGFNSLIFLELGCHVISFEPLKQNLLRARESVRANGLAERFTVFNNAVSNRESPLYMQFNEGNPGASTAYPQRLGGDWGGEKWTCVMSVTMDAFFSWADRPLSPTTGLPVSPSEISFVKVDIEGHDVAAFDGMQGVLQAATPPIPFLTAEFSMLMAHHASRCWGEELLRMMIELGYASWDHYNVLLDAAALLARAEAASFRLPKEARKGQAPDYEFMFQHELVDKSVGLRLSN